MTTPLPFPCAACGHDSRRAALTDDRLCLRCAELHAEVPVTQEPEPLHVLVARAIGWTDVQWSTAQGAYGRHPSGKGGMDGRGYQQIPRYGMDTPDGWSVTGPLMSEHGFDIEAPLQAGQCWRAILFDGILGRLAAEMGIDNVPHAEGDSAPEAIARLVVKLHEMGKLKA